MLSKIIGAALGGKIARQSKSVGGATGAVIGAAAPFVLSRVSIPAMVALGVGGYVAKKYFGKSKDEEAAKTAPLDAQTITVTPKQAKPAKTANSVASIPQPATA